MKYRTSLLQYDFNSILRKLSPFELILVLTCLQAVIYTSSIGNITKTVYNPEAIKAKTAITSPTAVGSASFVSKIEAIKRQEEKKKEMLKKRAELQKQKHELLLKQVEQQKVGRYVCEQ